MRCDVFINEDSKKRARLRKGLWKEVKQLCSEDKIFYLNYRTAVTKRTNNEG